MGYSGMSLTSVVVGMALGMGVLLTSANLFLQTNQSSESAFIQMNIDAFHMNALQVVRSPTTVSGITVAGDPATTACFAQRGANCNSLLPARSIIVFNGANLNASYSPRSNGAQCVGGTQINALCAIQRRANYWFDCPTSDRCTAVGIRIETFFDNGSVESRARFIRRDTTIEIPAALLAGREQLNFGCSTDPPPIGGNFITGIDYQNLIVQCTAFTGLTQSTSGFRTEPLKIFATVPVSSSQWQDLESKTCSNNFGIGKVGLYNNDSSCATIEVFPPPLPCTGNTVGVPGFCTTCPVGTTPNPGNTACLPTNCTLQFSVNANPPQTTITTTEGEVVTVSYSANNSTNNTWSCDNGASGINLVNGIQFNAPPATTICTVTPLNSGGIAGTTCTATVNIQPVPAFAVCMNSCGAPWSTEVGGWADANAVGDLAYDTNCTGSLVNRGKHPGTAKVCARPDMASSIRLCINSCGPSSPWPNQVGGWRDTNTVGDYALGTNCDTTGGLFNRGTGATDTLFCSAAPVASSPLLVCAESCGNGYVQVGGWVDTNDVGDIVFGAGCNTSNYGLINPQPIVAVLCSKY